MEHDLNPEDKQVYEVDQGQGRLLSWAWFRLDSLAPEENHRLICAAHAVDECNSLKGHSWLLVLTGSLLSFFRQ